MLSIEGLWRSRIEEVMGIVAAGETTHRELAIIGEYVEADYHGRFLAELLQNANDQAVKSSMGETSVSIVRTQNFIGVANRGEPFDEDGLRSITSLGISPKDPSVLIGNKGIGFKSVFQVSRSPEIFSSSALRKQFHSAGAIRFCVSTEPFGSEESQTKLASIVEELISENPELSKKILPNGHKSNLHRIVSEVKEAAPFKFPIQLNDQRVNERLTLLSGIDGECETLVVLPLLEGEQVQTIVEAAIDDLLISSGASILFLPGISQITITDHVRKFETVIERRSIGNRKEMSGFEVVESVQTRLIRDGVTTAQLRWRVFSATLGGAGGVSADLLNEAAQELPGSKFEEIRHCPVAVALPVLEMDKVSPVISEPDGKICIGLPTQDLTGTPAWVHAHFYGNISRKDIDFETCRFNSLLFNEAVRLHELLLSDLRIDPDVDHRRAATIAYNRAEGPLAEALYDDADLVDKKLVLGVERVSFVTPTELLLCEPGEYHLVKKLLAASPLEPRSELLPEEKISLFAHHVLRSLEGHTLYTGEGLSYFITRNNGNQSLLENAAEKYRDESPTFWNEFVTWMLDNFDSDELMDQKVLPTGEGKLSASIDRVFLLPVERSKDESEIEDDEEGAEDLKSLPTDVLEGLRFLDESRIPVRTGKGRALTQIAGLLAPQVGGLVRSPRLDQLINDAIGPAMLLLGNTDVDLKRGLALLGLAIKWIERMTSKMRTNVDEAALLVPVRFNDNESISEFDWVPAKDAYFGDGWLDPNTEDLLNRVYGYRDLCQLIDWQQFSASAPVHLQSRDFALNIMSDVGVSRSPKVLVYNDRRGSPPLVSYSYDHLDIQYPTRCPIESAESFWDEYLAHAANRSALTCSGQPFAFSEVAWIDGLERSESRSEVMQLIIENPTQYESHLVTNLGRAYNQNTDVTEVTSLWVFTVSSNDWSILPTQKGLRRPSETWLLAPGQTGRARKRLDTLCFVDPKFKHAERILGAIGVAQLSDPSPDRIIEELDRIARTVSVVGPSQALQVLAMAEDLYERLKVCVTGDAENEPQELPNFDDKWILLKQGRSTVGVASHELTKAYLVDDSERAKFIEGIDEALVWPIQPRGKFRSFATQLREKLGDKSIEFTSEAKVTTGFVSLGLTTTPLLQWIKNSFQSQNVVIDLGCLIAFGGIRDTDPNGQAFDNIWTKFQTTDVVIGAFPSEAPSKSFFDVRKTEASQLQVDDQLDNFEILASTWRLVAKVYEDTWYRYSNHLMKNLADEFMKEKVSSVAQREEVLAVISGPAAIFDPLKAVFYALLGDEGVTISDFEDEWQDKSLSATSLSSWVGDRISKETLVETGYASTENGVIQCLTESGLSVLEWQSARRKLGQAPFEFASSRELWRETMSHILATLRATAARSAAADHSAIQGIFSKFVTDSVPQQIMESCCTAKQTLTHTIDHCRSFTEGIESVRVRDLLNRRLISLEEINIASPHDLKLDDPPYRDVREYLEKNQAQREIDARRHLDSLITVASKLAEANGEILDSRVIKEDPWISQLTKGEWANAYSLVVAIQAKLKEVSPLSFQDMTEKRVFRNKMSLNEMLALFPDLAKQSKLQRAVPKIPPVELYGRQYSQSDIDNELALGCGGSIGRAIASSVEKEHTSLRSLIENREQPVVPSRSRNKHKGKRPGKAGGAAKNAENELVGLLGEIFVYELFRHQNLPDFDESVWKSANRNTYLGDDTGNDSFGYDFEIVDLDGSLTGSQKPVRCLIEVKTTTGDGAGPFQMSVNEWSRATDAHYNSDEEYFIYRVAFAKDDKKQKLVAIIQDPYLLRKRAELELIANDFWVYVGPPISAEQGDL